MGVSLSFITQLLRGKRRGRRVVATSLLGLVMLTAGLAGFGVTPGDASRVRAFGEAVRRWQSNPDYRAVAREYVTLGVEAMQARWCGLSAPSVVVAFRSLPGLPDHLAVNDTSAAHYDLFSRGEMSAYLHLASEQGIADGIAMIEQLGAKRDALTDQDIVAFLGDFDLPAPTVSDAGAVASVRRLLEDVQAATPLPIRSDVTAQLRSCINGSLATMSRAQQAAEFAAFDARVRATNPELWRSKQVSDFLAGIWAQGYGQIYLDGIIGFFRVQRAARIVFVVAILACLGMLAGRRLKPTTAARSDDARAQSLVEAKRE